MCDLVFWRRPQHSIVVMFVCESKLLLDTIRIIKNDNNDVIMFWQFDICKMKFLWWGVIKANTINMHPFFS